MEGKYYAFMIGGKNGDISNNTCVAKAADPASESDVNSVSYGFMFSLSVFDQAVQLTNVDFHDNTIYYGVYHETDYDYARNYAVLFSISKSGVISDITKVTPLVEDFQMYDNNFINEADETITYFPIQWTIYKMIADAGFVY